MPIIVKEIELIPKSLGKRIRANTIFIMKMIPVENHAKIRKKMEPLTAEVDISSEVKKVCSLLYFSKL